MFSTWCPTSKHEFILTNILLLDTSWEIELEKKKKLDGGKEVKGEKSAH